MSDFEVLPSGTHKRLAHAADTLRHAAALLEQEAEALRTAHTVNGRWCDSCGDEVDAAARAEHDDMLGTARQLRALAAEGPA